MPQRWLFLSDPESYHYDALFQKKREVWDGVFGALAQKYIAEIKRGDRILGYHTAPEKSVYCELRAARGTYQNPELKEKNLVLDVAPVKKLKRPVTTSLPAAGAALRCVSATSSEPRAGGRVERSAFACRPCAALAWTLSAVR